MGVILIKNIYTLWGLETLSSACYILSESNPSIVALIVFENHSVHTDMARSTRLVILEEYIYSMGSETLPSAVYFMGSETLPSTSYIISYESSIPFYLTMFKLYPNKTM